LIFLLGKIEAEFKCAAAVSGEAIAKVYNEQKPNLTLLCGGARVYGKFKDDEFIISIPKKVYDKIKENYWNNISDAELLDFFKLSIEKNGGQIFQFLCGRQKYQSRTQDLRRIFPFQKQ